MEKDRDGRRTVVVVVLEAVEVAGEGERGRGRGEIVRLCGLLILRHGARG